MLWILGKLFFPFCSWAQRCKGTELACWTSLSLETASGQISVCEEGWGPWEGESRVTEQRAEHVSTDHMEEELGWPGGGSLGAGRGDVELDGLCSLYYSASLFVL